MQLRTLTTALLLGAITVLSLAPAEAGIAFTGSQNADSGTNTTTDSQDRLMIVNGNTGRVVYDDGYDDLFCVTRRVVVGYTYEGNPIFRRTLRCR